MQEIDEAIQKRIRELEPSSKETEREDVLLEYKDFEHNCTLTFDEVCLRRKCKVVFSRKFKTIKISKWDYFVFRLRPWFEALK